MVENECEACGSALPASISEIYEELVEQKMQLDMYGTIFRCAECYQLIADSDKVAMKIKDTDSNTYGDTRSLIE